MNYLQAPANAGSMQLLLMGVFALIVYFIFGRQKSANHQKGVSTSTIKEIKVLTIEAISEKISNSGSLLKKAGTNLMSTLFVLVVLGFLNIFYFVKIKDQTYINDFSSVKGDIDILIAINVLGGILIFMFQFIAFSSLKESGDNLMK